MNNFQATEMLSIRQAAELANVTTGTVRNWVARGQLRASRLGDKIIRIRRDDLEAMFKPCNGGAE